MRPHQTVRIAPAYGRLVHTRGSVRLQALAACILLVAAACAPTVPPPSAAAPSSAPLANASGAALRPAPEDCEDFDLVPCPRQVARLSVPLAGSSFSLTYASDRVPGRTITPSLAAAAIGLGGWSLDVLAGYDTSAAILVLGTGERRAVQASAVTLDGAAALAVPSVDGTQVFVFDVQGREKRSYDAITGTLLYRFAWDAAGLASVTERGGRMTRIRRDATGQPIEIVSARGYRMKLGTSGGWLAAVADPAGNITHITALPNGLVSALSDPTGATTTVVYDASGRLAELDGPNGVTAKYQRTDVDGGFTVAGTTGAGRTWSDTVRSDGTTVTRTHVDFSGLTTTVTVDGTTRTLTMPDGTVTSLELAGDPRWGLSAPLPVNVVSTTPAGRRQTATEAHATAVAAPTLDPSASTWTLTIAGAAWTIGYDPATRTTTLTDPDGRTRTTNLDAADRPIRVQISGYAPTAYHYDAHGRIDTVTVGDGASARVWHYADDRTTGDLVVTDPLGQATTIRADASGRISAVQAATGETVEGAYGSVGRLIGVTSPSGAASRTTYRGDGQLDTVTAPAGSGGPRYTTQGYDADGLVAQVGFVDGSVINVKRDAAGRISQVDAGAGPWSVGYDPASGVAATFRGPGATLQRTFDGSDLVSEAWTGPLATSVTRSLDPLGRDISDTVAGTPAIPYTYDAAGNLVGAGALKLTRDKATGLVTQEQIGSLTTAWRYDAFGAVVGQTVTSGTKPVYSLTLARDGLGRVTLRTEHVGTATHTRAFSYSALGRLTAVNDDGKTTTYAYDVNGNLTRETRPDGSTITATYDGRDALTRRGTTTYTYDSAGRLATETTPAGSTAYTYDRAGHLLAVSPSSGPKVEYVLDATGRRIGTKVGGELVGGFAYIDPLRPAAELDAGGGVTERFVYGLATSAPAYVVRDGKTLLVVTDDVGTPRLLVDSANGSLIGQLQTDALGRTTSDTDPGLLPFGFAGGLADPQTGLLHFGARDYDPAAGRWTAPDPLGIGGGDPNQYRYAAGDPVNRIDPAGLACDVFSVGLSGSAGWGGGVVSGGFGLAVGGTNLGVYAQQGAGLGTPGFGGVVTVSCLDEQPSGAPGTPLDKLGGEGASSDLSPGIFGFGGDASYSDGSKSLSGGHLSVGFQTPGASAQATGTQVLCLTCWDWLGDVDPGADGGDLVCSGDGCPPGPGATGANDEADGLDGPDSWGDPHLTTADAVHYDFMAVGEFTALRSDSGDLVVQVRQVPLEGSRSIAVNSAAAIGVAGDRLTFVTSAAGLVVRVNGQPFDASAPVTLPKGGVLTPEDQSFLVAWPDHTVARVMPYGSGLNVALQLAPGRVGTVHGLLGPDTRKPSTTIESKAGTLVDIPADGKLDYQKLYRTFGDSWRISAAESLFDYAPGESSATFTDPSFPDPNAPAIPADAAAAATALCTRVGLSGATLAGCAFDVATTGDAGFAVTDARSTLVGPQTLGEVAAGVPAQTVQGYAITVDGPEVGATIATVGAVARFTFSGTAGQKVYLAVSASTLPDDCGALRLVGPDNAQIGGGCIINGSGSIAGTVLPTTGTYAIVIDPGNGATGNIQLRLTSAIDQHTRIIVDGPTASATIGQSGASATFTFSGRAGQVVFLDIPSTTLPDDCGALSLHGPDNAQIGGGCIINGSGSIAGTVLPTTGTYSIVIDPGNGATGNIQLRLHT